ncbi:hypothetical protein L249_7896 [Ophiocordyceps polyrhachis-furcata BCC 54312]|uniref:C2H2-type domain-containing protein n=1 Tax=Ophiocordyceps polyrhachis-furcata BCC 54312 TaxID=1330021 RepID=A0A367LH05_9HYPO|nr:hypothetical protein L249_7896 [Ophiocordyceps polyrhachis-furcata BCC 54312]
MTTTTRHHQQPQSFAATDTFDPDEVVPRHSPLMQALRPKLELSPSPPPDIPAAQIRPTSGDAVLVSYLDNGRRPEIARAAGAQSLPGVDEDEDDSSQANSSRLCMGVVGRDCTASSYIAMSTPILQHLAADALQAVSLDPSLIPPPKLSSDISTSTRQLSISDEQPFQEAVYPYRRASRSSVKADTPGLTTASNLGELPPLQMDSPKSETNGQSLPSIRSTLGDIKRIHPEIATSVESDLPSLHSGVAVFSHSPPMSRPRFAAMSASHASPPISPSEAYQRSFPSPNSLPASSPYNYYHTNGLRQRPSLELGNSTAGELSCTDQSILTPATSASVADPMSIDGITNPLIGIYVCDFSGCTAPPFQTQYLLNSHANVHSSARPHYCPVKGCPRSEGGKGFKRKNEMIRHGLVHDSPGYVCPFCPDREHKYPRPDNLQRHVRVHHVDKDKDDPLLREVLSQRPDGPSRGRRKRGSVT